MAKTYRNTKYLENRPDVDKIFDDLDELLEFCKNEWLPFNEADLYNRHSRVWQRFEASKRPKKEGYQEHRRPRFNNNRRSK